MIHQLIKLIFWITDIAAWLLLAFATLAALTYPFAGPAWARMDHQQLSTTAIVITCLSWALAAFGALLVTRRRAIGIPLTIAPIVAAAAINGALLAGLVVSVIPAVFFGLPFLLVLLQVKQLRSKSAP
ncbi:MAG: hypothetical protein K6T33_05895 [Thermomonas hydrothermalis]|uniref:hypothetical protein n=1 Tax=Thermomonas hydrothermalis TaxID=213588 RepID=UPI002354EA0C|nr:hypothetical protein [Thermomonas hydrothermalis]MCL6619305.1 hypothetical protein [Thermomonas hydrothermalis]